MRPNRLRCFVLAVGLLVIPNLAANPAAASSGNILVMLTDGSRNVGARAWDALNHRWAFLSQSDLVYVGESGGSFAVARFDEPYFRVWGWATDLTEWYYSVLNVGEMGYVEQMVQSGNSILLLVSNGTRIKGALAWDGINGVWDDLPERDLFFVGESNGSLVVGEPEALGTRFWAWGPGATGWQQYYVHHDDEAGLTEVAGSGGNVLILCSTTGASNDVAVAFDAVNKQWSPRLDYDHMSLLQATSGSFVVTNTDGPQLRLWAWSRGGTIWVNGGGSVGDNGGVEQVIIPSTPCEPIPWDSDCDGDLDLFDFSAFLNRFTGPY